MSLCGESFLILVVLVVGCILWVLGATILRGLSSHTRRRRDRERCVRCGTIFAHSEPHCPSCGLDPESDFARELREIEIGARQIQVLVDQGTLDPDVAEVVYQGFEARQKGLVSGKRAAAPRPPVLGRLERLLAGAGELSQGGRLQALSWWGSLSRQEQARLSPGGLLALARLAPAGDPALEVYTLLVESHPDSAEAVQGALEAGRLAAELGRPATARRFLEWARERALSAEARDEAERLLRTLPERKEPVRKAVPPVAAAAPTAPPPAPPAPRRTWGQMLAAFMEDRNIFWGELVGGLLIVGCSLALVVSLWSTLEQQIPYFPFLVVAGITGALYAAGFYTLSHWKLESTSRGLLVIATLLTPLAFLVLAGLAHGRPAGPLDWGAALVAVGIFTLLVRWAASVLAAPLLGPATVRADWLLTLAVVGSSASPLLGSRGFEPGGPTFFVLGLVPVLFQGLAVALVLWGLGRDERLAARRANALLLLLGLTTFAVAAALGFLVYRADPLTTARYLAVPLALAGLPLLAAGALVRDRLADEEASPDGLSPAVSRLAGTAVGLAGAVLMLAGVALGWPRPAALVFLGVVNAIAFLGVALRLRLPQAHPLASACLAVGVLTLYHWATGEGELLAAAASPAGGVGLTVLAGVLTLLGEGLSRRGRLADGLYQAAAAGVAALLALAAVLPEGDATPARGALVFGACGLGALLANLRWREPDLTRLGSAVVLGAVVYAVCWAAPQLPAERRWLWALLLHATVLGAVGGLLSVGGAKWARPVYAAPLRQTALAASFFALVPLALSVGWGTLTACALFALWLAAVWLAFAWADENPDLFAACQGAVTAATLFGVASWLRGRDWVGDDPEWLLHLWSLQAFALGLAVLGLVWAALRRLGRRSDRASALLEPRWMVLDQMLLGGLVVGQLVVAAAALTPELAREISGSTLSLPPLHLGAAWGLLAVLALGVAAMGERWPRAAVLLLAVLVMSTPVLGAHGFRDDRASASALRWGLAVCFVLCSAAVWARGRLTGRAADNTARHVRAVLLVLGSPVLLLTAWVAARAFAGEPVPGPAAESVFGWMGWTVSMTVPLGLVVVGLTGHGVCEGLPGYLFAAGQVLLAAVTGGYALGVVVRGGSIGPVEGVRVVQLGVLTAALWALGWLAAGRWRSLPLLGTQASLAAAGGLVLLVPALATLLSGVGGTLPGHLGAVGAAAGWVGWVAAAAAGLWVVRLADPRRAVHVLAGAGVGVGVLAACGAAWAGSWTAYHVLTMAWTLLALGLLAAAWVGEGARALGPGYWPAARRARAADLLRELVPAAPARRWVEVLGVAVVLLALGGAWGDPGRPYWSAAATLAVALLVGAMAVWARRPGYVYASGLLLNVVAYLAWQAWVVDAWGLTAWVAAGPGLTDTFLLTQALALAAASVVWSLIEARLRRREPPVDLRGRAMPFAHVAALLALHVVAVLVLAGLAGNLSPLQVRIEGFLPWLALAATAAALALCLWDPEAGTWGLPAAPLYAAGLLGVGLLLHQMGLAPRDLAWAAGPALGAYVLAVAVLVRPGFPGGTLARRLGIASQAESRLAGWFVPAQGVVGLAALGLSLWICLGFPTTAERLGGPLATGLLLAAGVVVAGYRPGLAVRGTLVLGVVVAAELGWALLDPTGPAPWLNATARLLAVLAVMAGLYGSGLAGWAGRWAEEARRLGPVLGGLAGAVLAAVLAQEFVLYDPQARRAPLAGFDVLLVAALLAVGVVAALWLAVSRHDPFRLGERGRAGCVWGAELLLALLLVHLRLCVPDIFPGFVGRHWPLVIMALGFAGVGLGEVFARRGLPALAGPLQLTGLFLPLLPLLAYLVRPLANLGALGETVPGLQPLLRYLERLPAGQGWHALLWFLLAGLYAWAAMLRRTTGLALVAALAANFGLWALYAGHDQLAFRLHPQLWLIPVGLIVLAAEHLNRERLSPAQATSTRYLGLLLVYVSSAADMFVTGLGNSVWLPVILAVLSTAGVLAGILLRVRGFLFTGVAFLVLVVLAQIWHAAVDRAQTWVWWASGIVLGVAILSLFALFEKRRNDVLRILDDIRHWR